MGSNPIPDKPFYLGGLQGSSTPSPHTVGVWRAWPSPITDRGYSSVVEHPAAVRQVLGSTPSVPYLFFQPFGSN